MSGYITDAETGEMLIGAVFQVVGEKIGGSTNSYGFYSVASPAGEQVFRWSFIGYEAFEDTVTVEDDITLDIAIAPEPLELEEIVVKSRIDNTNVTSAEMGTIELTPQETADMPVLFGERDMLKTIQLLPGIGETSEGMSGFFVRGGGMFGGAPANPTTNLSNGALGYFSAFSTDTDMLVIEE